MSGQRRKNCARQCLVEILQIDTADSRTLYRDLGVNDQEKAQCQGFLKQYFREICEHHDGDVRGWAGDGGHAIFPCDTAGKSVEAAEEILDKLEKIHNAQITEFLHLKQNSFSRKLRISIHRGEIWIAHSGDVDAGHPSSFDDFLKFAKKFSPHVNQVYVTSTLHESLTASRKKSFDEYGSIKLDGGKAGLFLLRRAPRLEPSAKRKLTGEDWKYFRQQIEVQKVNVAARNRITTGLVELVRQHGGFTHQDILAITLTTLYNYLRAVHGEHLFRVSYWGIRTEAKREVARMVAYKYPPGLKTDLRKRKLPLENHHFVVCRAIATRSTQVVPSVRACHRCGEFTYFDSYQQKSKRSLESLIVIPVFSKADGDKHMHGALCIDTNKPNTFLVEEIDLWRDELVGFLANLSLSETLRETAKMPSYTRTR